MFCRKGEDVKKFLLQLLGGRLRTTLIISFALVAVLTVGLNAIAVSRVINDYLSSAEAERVARDMKLAETLYQLKLDEVAAISHRLALDQWVLENFPKAAQKDPHAIQIIDRQITNKIIVLALGGTHLIALLDTEGNLVTGKVLWPDGELSPPLTEGQFGDLPIFRTTIETGKPQAATEIIPKEILAQVGLDKQAYIPLLETPLAAPEPFDPREGTAGLALVGVFPLKDNEGNLLGAVLSAYMFNNDYTLVDRIKEVAGIDTVTIFLGDLRVSTNVTDEAGRRAIGTRISQTVRKVVLEEGQEYIGRAFVVKEWFITRYEPLRDHKGNVVGSLYVGARESTFLALVRAFNQRVALIAIVCILLAAAIAFPIGHLIMLPLTELLEAHRRLAAGDMSVRVNIYGNGELAVLGRSFNSMVETLYRAQQELIHKEKLASMGQLAAGVAHELNNPLGTIMLFADALAQELPPDHPYQKDLKMILDEANRAKKIVAGLLNFARQQEVLAQDTDLHSLLDQVLENLRHQPIFAGIEIVKHYDPKVRIIQADPAQLQQVFINLLTNAAEAINGPGTITVTTRALNGQVEISIADTGCGIPPEHMNKLFTPFFTTKPPGKGTGLGLSIVYGIVKMHRGQINVQSEVGKGTTFTITLPVRWMGKAERPISSFEETIG